MISCRDEVAPLISLQPIKLSRHCGGNRQLLGSLLQHPSGSSIILSSLFPQAPHTLVAIQDGHALETCLVPLLHPHGQWDGAVALPIKTPPL